MSVASFAVVVGSVIRRKGILTRKTSFAATCFRIQNRLNRLQWTRRKFIIIPFISRCRPRKHYKIAVLTARRALIWIVLQWKRKKGVLFMKTFIIYDVIGDEMKILKDIDWILKITEFSNLIFFSNIF